MRFLKILGIALFLILSISSLLLAQPVREKIDFNNNWKFQLGEAHGAQFTLFDDSEWRTIDTPHDWSIEEKFSKDLASGQGYLPGGIGWYRKTFTLSEDKRDKKIQLLFDGVYQNAEVWINGEYLGKRPYGFISFSRELTEHLNFGDQENVVAVRVDHSNYADARWYTGSGITRQVWLKVMNPVHIKQWGTHIRTPEVSESEAAVKVTTTLVNDSDESQNITLKGMVNKSGKKISNGETSVHLPPNSERKVDQVLTVDNPNRWSVEHPHLYDYVTEIYSNNNIYDRKETKFGIRTFRFEADEGFFLNGKSMLIKGVCLHNDAGSLGSAVPKQEWKDRLKIMKEMGANAIRTSHNPPAPELLDLADEMGFIVMDEAFDEWEIGKKKWIKGWNVGEEEGAAGLNTYYSQHGYSDFFEDWAKKDLQDMIRRDRNHPSIVLWSIGNEIDYPNDPYTDPNRDNYQEWRPDGYHVTEIARKLYDYVKEIDTTRPVTAASANIPLANETGYAALLDVVGYNYQEEFYEEDHQDFPGRKMIGSENGDSYEAWLAVKNNDYIPGQFLWTGIDYLGEAGQFPNRSNGSGLVSLSNVRKPGFYYRQSLWSDEPMVYLSTINPSDENDWPEVQSHWNWEDYTNEEVEVIAYSNAESVELYLNGESMGTRKISEAENHTLRWSVPYQNGTLRAEAKNEGKKVATYTLSTAGEPYQIELKPNRSEIRANGKDISSVEVMVTDREGVVVPDARHKINFMIEGAGQNIGVGNSNHNSIEPYKADYRKVYNGKARIILQSNGKQGDINVKATGKGLQSAEVTIKAQ
ncbi:glycoside hydrolase family 2 TIM barrel-domain containing protein [Fodinibius sp. Rm-B-1B1-1]|uniref:glycoside hydrolase family 2 TIM barrel-domain containing protein n=1 Tax=Fodinibius alkaliphilus TaxID=3140241 RepID=UPI00315A9239